MAWTISSTSLRLGEESPHQSLVAVKLPSHPHHHHPCPSPMTSAKASCRVFLMLPLSSNTPQCTQQLEKSPQNIYHHMGLLCLKLYHGFQSGIEKTHSLALRMKSQQGSAWPSLVHFSNSLPKFIPTLGLLLFLVPLPVPPPSELHRVVLSLPSGSQLRSPAPGSLLPFFFLSFFFWPDPTLTKVAETSQACSVTGSFQNPNDLVY